MLENNYWFMHHRDMKHLASLEKFSCPLNILSIEFSAQELIEAESNCEHVKHTQIHWLSKGHRMIWEYSGKLNII